MNLVELLFDVENDSESGTDYSQSGNEMRHQLDEFGGELVMYEGTEYSSDSSAMGRSGSSAGEDWG